MPKATELLIEWIVTLILSVGLSYLPNWTPGLAIFWVIMPIIWYSLRRGVAVAVFTGALVGLFIGVLKGLFAQDFILTLLSLILPTTVVAIAGFFSKYTIRTAFNRKYTSTLLNTTTASLLATLAFVVILGISQYVSGASGMVEEWLGLATISWQQLMVDGLGTWLVSSLLFVLAVKGKPGLLIPRHTIHISPRERSHLLND